MTRAGIGIAEAAIVYRGTRPAQRQQQWWLALRPRRWCPSCSKISASLGPRFIFNSDDPSNDPGNFNGHRASLIDQNTITPTELLFLLSLRLSLHPTVLQKDRGMFNAVARARPRASLFRQRLIPQSSPKVLRFTRTRETLRIC